MVKNNFLSFFLGFSKTSHVSCSVVDPQAVYGYLTFILPSGDRRGTVGRPSERDEYEEVLWMNTIIRGGKSVVWWMNTILGGSHSFRKRKDVPGAKVVHFFEICKYLGSFYAIWEYFYQQKRQKLRKTTKVAETIKEAGKHQRQRETTKAAENDKGSGKQQRQRKTIKVAGNDKGSGKQ